jgi:hypothetical protein
VIRASARIVSNIAGYFPSRPDQVSNVRPGVLQVHDEVAGSLRHPRRRRMRGKHPGSGRGDWHARSPPGCASAPPVSVPVSMKSAASNASACERRKAAQVVTARSGPGSIPASRSISHTVEERDGDSERAHLAVHSPISPAAVLPRQAQHQCAGRSQGPGSATSLGAGCRGVMPGDQGCVSS